MCCYFCFKGRRCKARPWMSILYLLIGVTLLTVYLALSITFYIECWEFNDHDVSYYPFTCGSPAMWSCMAWVPLFFFTIITFLTFRYLFKQSKSTTKVLTSSRAWLIAFVTVASCVLYFIHICYLAYISNTIDENPGCDSNNKLAQINIETAYVDCSRIKTLNSLCIFFSILLITFIYFSLTFIFAIVNGSIATAVEFKTQETLKKLHLKEDEDDVKETESDQEQKERIKKQKMQNLSKFILGSRVIVRLSYRGNQGCYGTVKYYGKVKEYPTESTTAFPFLYGIHLDEKKGDHDGSIKGSRYFKCPMGFGVFAPLDHVKELPPEQDPMKNDTRPPAAYAAMDGDIAMDGDGDGDTNITILRNDEKMKRSSSINKGLLITRGEEPNHLFQGNLFYFLKQKCRFAGMVRTTKIGLISEINSIKTKSMINVVMPTTNRYIYNYLPLLSFNSKYDLYFSPERSAEQDPDEEFKQKENDLNNIPIINMWYLRLHESWKIHSNKIKSYGASDYHSSQWVVESSQRAAKWYKLLNIKNLNKHDSKIRFDTAPLPLFLKQQQNEMEEEKLNLNNFHNSAKQTLYSEISTHYVPMGIFHNKYNIAHKNEVGWLEGPPTNLLTEDSLIEIRFKRLIHEPVNEMKDILPYLNSKQYKIDSTDAKYGWFPIDWVYAEVDIDDTDLENKFSTEYNTYTQPYDSDDDDDNVMNKDTTSYNPYWFMKYPRIPLFILSVRVPINELKKYEQQIILQKYGVHNSPQQQQQQPPPQQILKPQQVVIKTKVKRSSKDRKKHKHHKHHKHHKNKDQRYYNNQDEHRYNKYKYASPKHNVKNKNQYRPSPQMMNDDDEESSDTEQRVQEIYDRHPPQIEMNKFKKHHNRHRHKRKKDKQYQEIDINEDDEDEEDETDEYTSNDDEEEEETNEEEESDDNNNNGRYREEYSDESDEETDDSEEYEEDDVEEEDVEEESEDEEEESSESEDTSNEHEEEEQIIRYKPSSRKYPSKSGHMSSRSNRSNRSHHSNRDISNNRSKYKHPKHSSSHHKSHRKKRSGI